MPVYTIETTYHLPVHRHRSYGADTPEAACLAAIHDEGWADAKEDVDTSGETYVSGIWEGQHAGYSGPVVSVPSQFGEMIQRKARHFEILLGLLKIMVADARANQPTPVDWVRKAWWAIAEGEAIHAGRA